MEPRRSEFEFEPWREAANSDSSETHPVPGPENPKGPTVSGQALECHGEPDRIRTCDPLIKSQLLYQLSYRPTTEALIRGLCA